MAQLPGCLSPREGELLALGPQHTGHRRSGCRRHDALQRIGRRWLGDNSGMAWLGTFKPLWVPAWFGSAFNIFLLRQFFLTIPMELSEAARIDGCSELGIFWRVILPLSRPALAVVALFAFMGIWNDFLGPLVYLQRPEQFTLALGLQNFQSKAGGTSWHLLMAASTLVVLPAILLFFLA